jgi:hypothetical protein
VLGYGKTYTLTAAAANAAGMQTKTTSTFSTVAPDNFTMPSFGVLDGGGGSEVTVRFGLLHLAGQSACHRQSYGRMIARVGHLILRITKGGTAFALPTSVALFWNPSTGIALLLPTRFLPPARCRGPLLDSQSGPGAV